MDHTSKSLYVSTLYRSSLANIIVNYPRCWARSVGDLVLSIGLGEAWQNQGMAMTVLFINVFKMRILDIAKYDWLSRPSNSDRARFYGAVNPQFEQIKYLEIVNFPSHREASSNFWQVAIDSDAKRGDGSDRLCHIKADVFSMRG